MRSNQQSLKLKEMKETTLALSLLDFLAACKSSQPSGNKDFKSKNSTKVITKS